MISNRFVRLAASACAALGLVSCALPLQEPAPDPEQQLAEFKLGCLAPGRPSNSPAHVACVITRYQERQVAQQRLREAIAPPQLEAQSPRVEKAMKWPESPWLI